MPLALEVSDVLRLLPVSGTYVANAHGDPLRVHALAFFETIRFDVDGTFPQMMASGTYQRAYRLVNNPAYWIAHPLKHIGHGTWEGPSCTSGATLP